MQQVSMPSSTEHTVEATTTSFVHLMAEPLHLSPLSLPLPPHAAEHQLPLVSKDTVNVLITKNIV